jgi:hypothetical protein
MAGTQIGLVYEIGVGETLDTYTITSVNRGDKNVASSDVNDEDGALTSRLIKQRHDKVDLEMVAKTGAAPETDFPVGLISVATGFTSYYVESMSYVRTEDHMKVSVSLVNIGVTTIT